MRNCNKVIKIYKGIYRNGFYLIPTVKIQCLFPDLVSRSNRVEIIFGLLMWTFRICFSEEPRPIKIFNVKVNDQVKYMGVRYKVTGFNYRDKSVFLIDRYKKITVNLEDLYKYGEKVNEKRT